MTPQSALPRWSRYLDVSSAPGLWLGALTVAAALIRWVVARNEGLWRDEGLFLAIVRLPHWSDTIDFLQFHESHPPLFYALVRSWLRLAGGTDQSAVVLLAILGTLLVPAIYFVGARLYGPRVGALAAVLAAISPVLTEYAGMVRPYPLLQLLLLASTYSLAIALEKASIKYWSVFAVSTLAMIYTHNWAWLIAAGDAAAFAIFVFSRPRERRRLIVQGMGAAAAIALAFAPWARSLLYQSSHAGYTPLVVDVWNYILVIPFTLQATVLPGVGSPIQKLAVTLGATLFGLCAGVLWLSRRALHSGRPQVPRVLVPWQPVSHTATMIFLALSLTSLGMALVLSTHSNLLQPRCLAILTPIGLIGLAAAADHQWRTARHVVGKAGLVCGAALVFGLYVGGIARLLTTHKSNARELAAAIAAKSRPNDLVLLVPEWLASSFNRYFEPANEQIDYPRTGREDAVDFAGLMPRLKDPAALMRTAGALNEARTAGRRVWLVSERPYFLPLKSRQPIDVMNPPDSLVIQIRLQQLRNTLISLYGKPDTTLARGKPRDRYEHLIAYLFTPGLSGTATSGAGK